MATAAARLACTAVAGSQGVEAADPWRTHTAYARIGLVGNPSDGFFGKTIAVAVSNWKASVRIRPSPRIVLEPHPVCDPHAFDSMEELHRAYSKQGYQGGIILLEATCKKFCEYCKKHQIDLSGKGGFTLQYDTNIPRQVGLAGSSALITATLNCLLDFYGLGEDAMPMPVRPSFVLSVEVEELSIQAGLQDRVIQTYQGCMFMDFAKEMLEARGHGAYERIPTSTLPPLWLAYVADPSNSGKIHSDVKARWQGGDAEVVAAMKTFARFTDEAHTSLLARDWASLGKLMESNFDLRRQIYGDACLGAANLAMVALAKELGLPAKFSGSGGAVVGMCFDKAQMEVAARAYTERGFLFAQLTPVEP